MAMRAGCKHYQSRTYPGGETARWCALDLAPEAPWRCPADCPAYEPRLADVNWSHGSLTGTVTPDPPDSLTDDPDSVSALLRSAEQIVNAAGADIVAEIDAEPQRSDGARGRFSRWFRRDRSDP